MCLFHSPLQRSYLNIRWKVVEGESGTYNQYLYTSFIHQMALDTWHKYHAMFMQLVSF